MAPKPYLAALIPRLEAIGFEKRAGGIFTCPLAEGVEGWLGLNTATKHLGRGEVQVNPVVGVRHQGVERLVAELCGREFHSYVPPTTSTPIGYLLPARTFTQWHFALGDEAREADALSEAVAKYGLPYMRARSELGDLCRALAEEGAGLEHQLIYCRPVAWLLLGDRARARQVLAQSVASLGDRADGAAAEFRRFAVAFHAHVEALAL